MTVEKHKYNTCLANYFFAQPLFFDGDLQKKPHIRKCMELPFHQTKAELWGEVTDTLCNLDFIQAKAVAKMTYDLVKDFNDVLEVIPDNAENIRAEKARQARMEKYTRDLIRCARGEITRFELEVPECITPWALEQIDAEIECIKTNQDRLDKIKNFVNFLGQEAGNIQSYAHEFPHFATQQAWNFAANGPVGKAAEELHLLKRNSIMLKSQSTRPPWNHLPTVIRTLKGHTGSVTSVAITPDGKRAISGSEDKNYRLWDLDTGQTIRTLKGHGNDLVTCVSITPNGRKAIIGSSHNTCILWDLDMGKVLKYLKGHNDCVSSVSITPDGSRAVSGSWDKTCLLWDLATGEILKTLKGHNGSINAISITPDGKRAVTGAIDRTAILWDLDTGEALKVLRGHTESVEAISITPEGKYAISGSIDQTCIFWDLDSGEALKILKGHSGAVETVSITPDGGSAISGSDDNTCILWDLKTRETPRTFIGHSLQVNSVFITPDGARAISGSNDMKCKWWDLNQNEGNRTVNELINSTLNWYIKSDGKVQITKHKLISAVSITPDGKRAVLSTLANDSILWDLCAGKALKELVGHTNEVTAVAITPDGKVAVTGSADMTCILWNLYTGEALKTFKFKSNINTVAITPDGKNAVTGLYCSECIVWNLNTGEVRKTLKGHILEVKVISITSDGRRAVSGAEDKTCILWDLNTGDALRTLSGHTSTVSTIAITPDGKGAVSGSHDTTCILWDLGKGKAAKTLNWHTGVITAVSITPDGRRAISSSHDKTCILWNLKNGEPISRFVPNSEILAAVCFLDFIFCVDSSNNVSILKVTNDLLDNCQYIVTIRNLWDSEFLYYHRLAANCPLCGHRFAPPASVLTTIETITKKAGLRPDQSPCLELPDEAWEDPGLLGNCPKCKAALKFNPFIAGDS